MDGAAAFWIFIIIIIVILLIVWAVWASRRRLAAGAACSNGSQCASGNCALNASIQGAPKVCCVGGTRTTDDGTVYCAGIQ